MTLYKKIKSAYYIRLLRILQHLTWKYEHKLEDNLLNLPKDFRSIMKKVDETVAQRRIDISPELVRQKADVIRKSDEMHYANKLV